MDVFSFVIASNSLAPLCGKLARGVECPPDRLQLSMLGNGARSRTFLLSIYILMLEAI